MSHSDHKPKDLVPKETADVHNSNSTTFSEAKEGEPQITDVRKSTKVVLNSPPGVGPPTNSDPSAVSRAEVPIDSAKTEADLGRLGPFRLLRVLGRGGMGIVYLAFDEKLHRQVALKTMLPQSADCPEARERFLREARAAARISSDHVVVIHSAGEADGIPFIAQQYLEGCTLDELVKSQGSLPPEQIVRIAKETCRGLAAAHKLGITHRDIKPSNLWLEGDRQRVKILDFGLARANIHRVDLTQSGDIVGTPSYMSPEQARGDCVDERSDLFSLGAVLYRLCCGQLPFPGNSAIEILTALASRDPLPVQQVNPEIPAGLAEIVHRLLAKDREGRFASANATLDALMGLSTPAERSHSLQAYPPQTLSSAASSAGEQSPVNWHSVLFGLVRRPAFLIVAASLIAIGAIFAQFKLRPSDQANTTASDSTVPVPQLNPAANFDAARKRIAAVDLEMTVPRVECAYEVSTETDITRYSPPFIVGVLADLSGNIDSERLEFSSALRRFVSIDRDNIEEVMARMAPTLQLSIRDRLTGVGTQTVTLRFSSTRSFHPESIASQIPDLARLLEQREDAVTKIPVSKARLDAIDQRLTSQLREIYYAPEFRRLEASWRGLQTLVQHVNTGPDLKIRLLNVRKKELMDDILSANDSRQTEVFRRIFELEYGRPGGEPFGLLIGDFEIGPAADDAFLLQSIGSVAAFAGAPIILSPSASLLGVNSWSEIVPGSDLQPREEQAIWQEFRASSDARFVALALPRVLARLPYSKRLDNQDKFTFEELPPGSSNSELPTVERASELLWMSPTWHIAAEVADKVKKYGWAARISGELGGGQLATLPAEVRSRDSPRSMEILLDQSQQMDLLRQGYLPLDPGDENGVPMLLRAQSCSPGVRLNELLCAASFLRVLRMVARDNVVILWDLNDLNHYFQLWLSNYCSADGLAAPLNERPKAPLLDATVKVSELGEHAYNLQLTARPYYQFDDAPHETVEFAVPLGVTPLTQRR